jgi:uncharacterized membrane protein
VSELADEQRSARTRTLARTVAFTDASVAIALTLFILPLADAASTAGDLPVATLLRAQRAEIVGFFLSFVVTIRFWTLHRRAWEGLVDFDEVVLGLNFAWLATIVFLPFSTALLTTSHELTTGGVVFYIATLLVTSISAQAMSWRIHARPALRLSVVADSTRIERQWQGFLATAVLLVAIAAACFQPSAGLLTLLLLVPARFLRFESVARLLRRGD